MVSNDCESPSRQRTDDETGIPTRFLCRERDDRALPVGDAHELLADERRRAFLYRLREVYPAEATLDSVVRHLAESDRFQIDGAGDEETRELLYLSFVHSHVPKLEEAAVIDWNEQEETLRYRGDPVLDALLNVSYTLDSR